ncbi:hypothetical protein CFC21_099937 [Triticum aestivum]|uniref:Uncharacterized protein n=2 Tax=Triticum aestivum TaxID=4565 RepID=A0A9R1LZX9_WHEAT|nr:hypothetical protein CFC21_099937 [Triticum aestivum]
MGAITCTLLTAWNLSKGHPHFDEPPAYPYLHIRNKEFPWLDIGMTSLISVLPEANPVVSGTNTYSRRLTFFESHGFDFGKGDRPHRLLVLASSRFCSVSFICYTI